MFCPKCGNRLPDGSAFCGKCGTRLAAPAGAGGRPTAGPTPSKAAVPNAAPSRPAAPPAAAKAPALAVAAAVLAAAAVVLSLLPWLEVDPVVSAASGYAGGLASLLGAGDGSFSFDESYAVWALPSFAGAFGDYASLYGALGGEGAGAASALVGGAAWGCLLLWLAGVVLLALGAVRIAPVRPQGRPRGRRRRHGRLRRGLLRAVGALGRHRLGHGVPADVPGGLCCRRRVRPRSEERLGGSPCSAPNAATGCRTVPSSARSAARRWEGRPTPLPHLPRRSAPASSRV